jgi:hypothetical protein
VDHDHAGAFGRRGLRQVALPCPEPCGDG